MTSARPATVAGQLVLTSSLPVAPRGHSPSRSVVSWRSSNTSSHSRLVSPSQPAKRAATDSAVPVGAIPVAATDASTYPDSTDARLVAEIQISASMARDRHSDSAVMAAIWVLPEAPSQFGSLPAEAGLDTSAADEPGTRAFTRPPALSGRSVNPSTSGGTSPTRNLDVGSAGPRTGHHRPPTPLANAASETHPNSY